MSPISRVAGDAGRPPGAPAVAAVQPIVGHSRHHRIRRAEGPKGSVVLPTRPFCGLSRHGCVAGRLPRRHYRREPPTSPCRSSVCRNAPPARLRRNALHRISCDRPTQHRGGVCEPTCWALPALRRARRAKPVILKDLVRCIVVACVVRDDAGAACGGLQSASDRFRRKAFQGPLVEAAKRAFNVNGSLFAPLLFFSTPKLDDLPPPLMDEIE